MSACPDHIWRIVNKYKSQRKPLISIDYTPDVGSSKVNSRSLKMALDLVMLGGKIREGTRCNWADEVMKEAKEQAKNATREWEVVTKNGLPRSFREIVPSLSIEETGRRLERMQWDRDIQIGSYVELVQDRKVTSVAGMEELLPLIAEVISSGTAEPVLAFMAAYKFAATAKSNCFFGYKNGLKSNVFHLVRNRFNKKSYRLVRFKMDFNTSDSSFYGVGVTSTSCTISRAVWTIAV